MFLTETCCDLVDFVMCLTVKADEAAGDAVADVVHLNELVNVLGVSADFGKGKGHNSCIYQICNMDSGKGFGNDHSNAEIKRHQRGMLTG